MLIGHSTDAGSLDHRRDIQPSFDSLQAVHRRPVLPHLSNIKGPEISQSLLCHPRHIWAVGLLQLDFRVYTCGRILGRHHWHHGSMHGPERRHVLQCRPQHCQRLCHCCRPYTSLAKITNTEKTKVYPNGCLWRRHLRICHVHCPTSLSIPNW